MPKELFDKCKFYALSDALTHIATGNEKRSLRSVVCKQGFVPTGVDGSMKGWQEDFLQDIGLGDLSEDNFKRMGGVDGVHCCTPKRIKHVMTNLGKDGSADELSPGEPSTKVACACDA
ncbi:unnamed protein product [Penicillium bialowiezense]